MQAKELGQFVFLQPANSVVDEHTRLSHTFFIPAVQPADLPHFPQKRACTSFTARLERRRAATAS